MTLKESRRHFLKKSILTTGGGFLTVCGYHVAEGSEIGRIWSGWREGEMEIHSIYTGLGESIFHLLPDGTSLLIDAGDHHPRSDIKVDALPDETRHPGQWIARYIKRVNPQGEDIDYMLLSHFHRDHAGSCRYAAGRTEGRGEDYCISGLSEVGEYLHFNKAFDRGYPDYSDPFPVTDEVSVNFRKFLRWTMKEKGLEMEKFQVGSLDQINLKKDSGKYDFHIRNLCANGEFWTGKGTQTQELYANHENKRINENSLSLGLLFSYGPFRYLSAGDIDESSTDENKNIVPIERLVGRAAGPVDVCKANHHAAHDAMGSDFVKAVRARVYTVNVWDQWHTSDRTLDSMMSEELYSGPRLVCPTVFPSSRRIACEKKPYYNAIARDGGHVVIKVYDDGRRYKIYYLTANDESMRIKNVYGPFDSHKSQG